MIDINELLKPPKIIAVIGLSDKSERPSNQVAKYLIEQGLTIIPVNPNIESVFGLKSYKDLSEIPKDFKIDIVDIFRKESEVLPIVEDIINTGQKPVVWLQEGFFSPEAKTLAKKHNLELVEGMCLMKAYERKKAD
jgi:hypothetical protein